ncbi:MAG: hypothetical protein ACYTAS_01340 [Planctomycetota bacterium]
MHSRSAFHLDCTAMLSECGCQCAKCIEEMKAVFLKTPGVEKLYREEGGIVVEHDATVVGVDQLIALFQGLPSFYEGCFGPTMMTS